MGNGLEYCFVEDLDRFRRGMFSECRVFLDGVWFIFSVDGFKGLVLF